MDDPDYVDHMFEQAITHLLAGNTSIAVRALELAVLAIDRRQQR